MSIAEDLLSPITAAKPGGDNFRYNPIYEKIKEARRKEDPIAQGEWQRALKEADYRLVIKLSTEALTRNTKDLQIAAWLTEALTYEEEFSGLTAGLQLLKGLLENFWDTVYPEIEDGDLGLRAAPLSWVGEYRDLERAIRSIAVTKGGLSWFKYKESRTVGYEADLGDSDSKRQARNEAINDGKMTAEEFDADVALTQLSALEELMAEADASLTALQALDDICQQRFGDDAPSFRVLRIAIEDVQHTGRMLAGTKPQKQPEVEVEEVEAELDESAPAEGIVSAAPAGPGKASGRVKAARVELATAEDAIARISEAAAFLRRENPYSPAPYLTLRGLRWGELRASGDGPNPELLEAPNTEIRQQLKRLMLNGEWQQMLEAAEAAMALPCGRGWLDLQRYVVRACTELGDSYAPIAQAIQSELCTLLKDLPNLSSMTLLDDTATANVETQAWLTQLMPPAPAPAQPASEPRVVTIMQPIAATSGAAPADAYELALDAARSGDTENAMQILSQQIGQERSGRGRFLRRMQLAQICVFSNRHTIAFPILRDLAQEIELRRLESWEQPDGIAQTLALLLQTMQKLRFAEDEKRKIYAQICVLDPVQAARLAD